jgi:hypothetical protein
VNKTRQVKLGTGRTGEQEQGPELGRTFYNRGAQEQDDDNDDDGARSRSSRRRTNTNAATNNHTTAIDDDAIDTDGEL